MARAVFAGALVVAAPVRAEEPISEEAKLYFRNGVDLIQATPPNYQDAYYQFKLAYEKSRSWKVLGNLGLCAFKLERDGEALDAYTEYLKSGGTEIDPEERKQLERDVLLITGNSATVNLVSSLPDAELIDTRAGTAVPPQTYKFQSGSLSLRLRAGTHTLTATSADGKHDRWEVVLSPGKTVEHRFDFGAGAAAAAAPPAVPPPASAPSRTADTGTESGGSGVRTLGFVALGVGAAAVAGGVVTGVLAKGKESDATGQCSADMVCPTAAEADFDSASSLASVSTILFIGGGVLAAAGVGMVVFGGGGSEAPAAALVSPRLELAPAIGAGSAGVWAKGTFW